ncbi:MAG: carotenoid oxygenase family protein [Acidimicrobiales bacterium]|jgi:carotenoid cleavage dioxygenase|nr:carotenoid oxygenase family protein [Acidimicrobiales bacterium]
MSVTRSPYLEGPFAPVDTEVAATDLEVVGELPDDLSGVYVRNGSNPRFEPKGRYHWFDGDGMVHAVHLADGTASYANRWVRTSAFDAESAAGECLFTGIEEPIDLANPLGPFKDSANTDLVYHNGRLLALWWLGGEAYRVRLPDLATCGTETFGGAMPTLSAHPKLDPRTGELIVFDYQPFPPYLTYGVISADGEVVHRTEVDLPGPRLQHDIAITDRWSVLMDMSMLFDPDQLAKGRSKLRFYRDKPTRFGLIPRYGDGSEVRWFDAEPCFMYHVVNAWEEGDDRVVLVGCRIADPIAHDGEEEIPTIGKLRLEPYLHRWTFDLATGVLKEEQLDDTVGEFPRIDQRAMGRPSRYGYVQRFVPAPSLTFDAVIKYDTETGSSQTHRWPTGWYGGETAFAPRQGAQGEDDGYLVTFVVEEATGASELHVVDAQRPTDEAVARVRLPQRVPIGYHCWWVPAEELAGQRTL